MKVKKIRYTDIRGFNYQPSNGTNQLEIWRKFDAELVKKELGLGKEYFPKMNAIRIWLSYDFFQRDPEACAGRFKKMLQIAKEYNLLVMPVLFNRWHDDHLDCGGIHVEHFFSALTWKDSHKTHKQFFVDYLEHIVGRHAKDSRIFAWDLCNEPFAYEEPDRFPEIYQAELEWLKGLGHKCKDLGAVAPITVGIHPGHGLRGIRDIEPISDILSIHPYWVPNLSCEITKKPSYEKLLDEYVQFASRVNKPLLATETCWGSLDDSERVEIIRYTLGQLKKRGIGWLAHLLHHSGIADAHRPEFGPVGRPGNLSFIEADGSLRLGHGIFNEF